jgi:hypothetical protein
MSGRRRRNRVVAEITLAHIRQLATVFGCAASEEEVLTFLNENGHAYGMWMCMMEAAEDFIKNNLRIGLRNSDVGQLKQKSVVAETCYFPTYATRADEISDLNKHLRI